MKAGLWPSRNTLLCPHTAPTAIDSPSAALDPQPELRTRQYRAGTRGSEPHSMKVHRVAPDRGRPPFRRL